MIGLFKTEAISRRGPWRGPDAVEIATLEWVDWFNNRRLLEPIGDIPPAEAEAIERAVWQHVAGLLAEPAQLLAQFDRLAAAEAGSPRDQAAERRLRSRLERITRADGRLLDAYQAEAISLAELTERRRQLAKERQDVERQREERARLRQQRLQAETV